MGVKRSIFFGGIVLMLSGLGLAILFTVIGYDGTRKEVQLAKDSLINLNGNAALIALSVSASVAVFATFLFKFCRPLNKDEDSW